RMVGWRSRASQAERLAIRLRVGHPEVPLHPCLQRLALLLSDHDDGAAVQAGEPRHDGLVVAVQAVAVQFQEAVADPPNVVERGWPLRMPGDLRALPGGEAGVDLRLELVELRAELAEIVLHAGPTLAHSGQLLDLLLDLRDGFLEF